MLQTLSRIAKSGGVSYDVTITFTGMSEENVQQDAMSFYVWKIQRQIREANEKKRKEWAENGIQSHARDVGKQILTTQEMVEKMSPDQKRELFQLLQKQM